MFSEKASPLLALTASSLSVTMAEPVQSPFVVAGTVQTTFGAPVLRT